MFGLLGEKLRHSYSKLIHEKLGYSYDLIERAPEKLAAFLLDGEFDGLNVTIPYKKTVMEYCHQVSDLAKRIGAVNTIYKEDDRLMGTNTDYEGLRYALGRANISLTGKKVLILGGTGGAGSMASILAADEGAGEILIATRGDKAFHGDRLFDSHSPGQSAKQKACPRETPCHLSYDELPGDVEIIINATPVGTYPEIYNSPVELAGFERLEGVVDLIYNPLRTELLMQARELGINYSNGLPMLVRQATEAAGYFHPEKKVECLGRTEEILSWLESSIENIVLIGMPGSGKTSIGKRLAKELGRGFVDTDRAARELAGKSPAEIIKESGDQAFRDIESKAVRMVAKEHSAVIATGGGTPLRPENMRALKQNGRVFFLDRDPDKLSTFNRPLSQNGGVYKLYDQRYDIYKAACDELIKNNGEDFTPSYENILKHYK